MYEAGRVEDYPGTIFWHSTYTYEICVGVTKPMQILVSGPRWGSGEMAGSPPSLGWGGTGDGLLREAATAL